MSLYWWALPLVITVILFSNVSSVTMTCAKCGRYIDDGRYVQVGDQYYHPDHFVCARCDKPIGASQYYSRDGINYDRACYEEQFALKCAWCGKIIEGDYTIRDGNNYHQACFTANLAPKCGWCGEPILDSFVTYEGNSYHNKCYSEHVGLRCGLCGGTIEGQYITTFRGGAWHSWHKGKVPECDFCGALIDTSKSGTYVCYSDNRYLCSQCGATAVTDIDSARQIAANVASVLSGMSMLISTENLEFVLAGQSEMDAQGGHTGRDRRGFTDYRQYSRMFGLFKEQRLTVYILSGMPTIECIEVLAHELMHAWLFTQGRTQTAPQLCEGSCNYASLLVLKRYPGVESDYIKERMLKDTDSVYGEGLRRVKNWVEDKGTAAWLNYITTNDKNPW
jgi:hypothetical protein